MRKSEVAGVVSILEDSAEYETPEDAAKAIIKWLDDDRAKRTSYVAVMQFGSGASTPFYVGLGPYPGKTSAKNAALAHPAACEAFRIVVVPTTSEEGIKEWIKQIG